MCIDDAEEVDDLVRQNGLDSVYMVTPNTTDVRRAKIADLCNGFIYTVSVLGVTRQLAHAGADGVIVGSAIVKIVENHLDESEKCRNELATFITNMKNALKT